MRTFHSLRVAEIHPEAEDAVGVSLEVPQELREEYRGLPGQHVVVRMEVDEEDVRRTYSLVGTPGESPLRIVARVHPEGRMSRYLAEQLNVGDHLDVLAPNGSFTPRRAEEAKGTYVAFASGCGVTPVLTIVRSLLAVNEGNRVIVFYGNANTARAMCVEELLGLKDRYLGRLSLHFVMSREPQEVELYNGRLDADRVRRFANVLFRPGDVTEFFVCGPGNMIDEVSATLRELGVAADRIHGEHFTLATTSAGEGAAAAVTSGGAGIEAGIAAGADARAAEDAAPSGATKSARDAGVSATGGAAKGAAGAGMSVAGGAATGATGSVPAEGAAPPRGAAASDTTGTTPASGRKLAPDESEVTVLMDGRRRTFTMRMNDEVILDAAMKAGLELPFACRAGVCSTCRTKVVRGEVEMAQNYALEDWEVEQGYVLACQSKVTTPALELDYDEK